ncbi:MAG: exosortase E/protease, VPEID-CTERM system [Planctomycetaceae bacterium]|nr:exosortase E/protease, VPEID-CTERM system [Planctomycetaceae bacterium]
MPEAASEVRGVAAGIAERHLPLRRRLLFVFSVLAAEVIGLTIRFDSGKLEINCLCELVHYGRFLVQISIAAAAVLLLLGQRRKPLVVEWLTPSEGWHRGWLYLFAHLAAFFLFAGLTAELFEGGSRPPLPAFLLGIEWAGMALLTLLSWFALWIAPDRFFRKLRDNSGIILGAAAIGVSAWSLGRVADSLWPTLSRSTLLVVAWLLRLVFTGVVVQPDDLLVGTPSFLVEVAPQCSGFEGIGLLLVLLGSFLWLDRDNLRFPHAFLLLPLGVACIWLLNAVRIFGLIVLGTQGFSEVAQGGFHSLAGWFAFTAVGLGLIHWARSWAFLARDRTLVQESAVCSPSAPYLVPLIVLVVTAMISRAFTKGFDSFYPARVVAAGLCLWIYRKRYDELHLTFSWKSVGVGVVVFLIWIIPELLAFHGGTTSSAGLIEPSRPTGTRWIVWLAFRVLGSVVTVPLVEELAFRGYLTRRLIRPDYWSLPVGAFSWASFLISSALFGMMHSRWIVGTLSGMVFALVLYRRRNLFDAVVAHATANGLIAAYVLSSGDWSLWA